MEVVRSSETLAKYHNTQRHIQKDCNLYIASPLQRPPFNNFKDGGHYMYHLIPALRPQNAFTCFGKTPTIQSDSFTRLALITMPLQWRRSVPFEVGTEFLRNIYDKFELQGVSIFGRSEPKL